MSFDLIAHLKRQIAFSRATFGPGKRTNGVIDHIRKELVEVERAEPGRERAREWIDIVILGLDGLTRELYGVNRYDTDDTAEAAVRMIVEKQNRNEARIWPDWRTASPDKAIEHERDGEEKSDA